MYPLDSGRESPSSICRAGPSTTANTGNDQSQIGVVDVSQEQAAVRAGQAMTSSREISEHARGAPRSRRHADGERAAAKKIEPVVLEVTVDSPDKQRVLRKRIRLTADRLQEQCPLPTVDYRCGAWEMFQGPSETSDERGTRRR